GLAERRRGGKENADNDADEAAGQRLGKGHIEVIPDVTLRDIDTPDRYGDSAWRREEQRMGQSRARRKFPGCEQHPENQQVLDGDERRTIVGCYARNGFRASCADDCHQWSPPRTERASSTRRLNSGVV